MKTVDPLDIIAKFGADAARLSLLMGATPGNDSRFSEERVEAKRNFINKFWNIARFIIGNIDETYLSVAPDRLPDGKTAADIWILEEFANLIERTTAFLDNFDFSLAAEELTQFTKETLADWYLEIAKFEKNKEEILVYLLKNLLILWHPFIPFVTEKIWSSWNEAEDNLLMVSRWPKKTGSKKTKKIQQNSADFRKVIRLIQKIRELRAEHKIEPGKKLQAVIRAGREHALIKEQELLIKSLRTGIAGLEITVDGPGPEGAIVGLSDDLEIYLLGAVDEEKEKARLAKEKETLKKLIAGQKNKLANSDFVSRAPEKIVAAEKDKLAGYEAAWEKIDKINL
jgi:valyl-tRNA synthetase